ncbi:ABC transporter permease [Aquibacillus sediminis]|uniref:ABC transporter permease n=1 Tax=Aquibacillus sediminis TaxID=2574734 RepID=UPI001107DF0F|nr:ABC transporter permease [Aquibacillus sediminis]
MKSILLTRLLHWRQQAWSLLFWLVLPMLATCIFITTADNWQQDTKIPIGLVVEDDSQMAIQLVEAINEHALFAVSNLETEQALIQLEQHQLDSVFVIEEGYQEHIKSNRRNQLITAYVSDMSLAYTPVKEAVASHIQRDAGSSKAAHTIMQLPGQYGVERDWSWDEIVTTSDQIRERESLLHSSFSFYNQQTKQEKESAPPSVWNVWGIWASIAVLTTFFLFDWVVKEQRPSMKQRLSLLKISFKSYLVRNGLIYLAVLFVADLVNSGLLLFYFQQSIQFDHLFAMISFRITISMLAFLFALRFRTPFFYYVAALSLTILLGLIGGALVPIDGLTIMLPWISYLSPITAFLNGQVLSSLFVVLLSIFCVWYWRKERTYA